MFVFLLLGGHTNLPGLCEAPALTSPVASGLRDQLWAELKAGAESGWDFTSRWYIDAEGHNGGALKDTRTSQILPVDLNALMCRTERTLASFCRLLGERPTPSPAALGRSAAPL